MDANKAPITANVTIAAAGIIEAAAVPVSKCLIANTYANVGDLERVSITIVFLVRSSTWNIGILVTHHAAKAPMIDKRMDGINIADTTAPPPVIEENVVDFATVTNVVEEPPATSTKVERTPKGGRNADTF